MAQPLAGIRVLDFTTLLPGPLATLMLAEAGAEVIKIERPGGEDMRRYDPKWQGEGAAFALLNRGKKSLVLDLKAQADRERLQPLLEQADILVEQFRPGVMARLGLGYEAVRKINPRIIYCSISGYGQDGPRAAEAGTRSQLYRPDRFACLATGAGDDLRSCRPPWSRISPADRFQPSSTSCWPCASAMRPVQGCHLDIAMTDAMFTFAWHALAAGFATGKFPASGESWLVGGSPRYQLYPTRDGKLVACGALEQHFWAAFHCRDQACGGIHRRPARSDSDAAAVAKIMAARTAEEWQPDSRRG